MSTAEIADVEARGVLEEWTARSGVTLGDPRPGGCGGGCGGRAAVAGAVLLLEHAATQGT